MTNKMKLPSILALILILFLSLSVVSASENNDIVTNTSDSVIDDSIAISETNNDLNTDIDNDLSSNLDDSKDEIIDSNESDDLDCQIIDSNEYYDSNNLDDEIIDSKSPKESKKLSDSKSGDDIVSSSDPIIVSAETIVIDSSTYSRYFDSNGLIKSGTLKDGDTIKIKSISNKVFTIDKKLNIISDDGQTLTNCIIRLVKGSSGSVLDNLKIVNTNEKISNYYLSGISIIDSANNIIKNSIINVSVHKCFAIMMSNASYNKIINNTLISGLSSTIPMTASSYNEIIGNRIESEYTNMIYQSAYGNGDFMPKDGEVCSGNIIANNYLKSRNGTYNSYCYAIYLMQSASGKGAVIANNTIENVYHAIIVESQNALIYNNTISKVGGPAAILTSGSDIVVSNNNVSVEFSNPTDPNIENWNPDGNVVAIQNTGKNNTIVNNTLKSVGSDTILNTGMNVAIINNTIYTDSANSINSAKSNVVIENNTFNCINSTAVMVYTSRLAENISIINNDIVTDKDAIVLRGNVSYTLVCDNTINISGDSDAIAVLKYTNRNPITPSHCAIYNNTINNQIVNMTDPSEIERNDTDNGTGSGSGEGSGTGTGDGSGSGEGSGSGTGDGSGSGGDAGDSGTGIDEGIYSDNKINTTIAIINSTVTKGNTLVICLKDKNGNPIRGQNVTFTILNKKYKNVTDSEGKARLLLNADIGNYTMKISFAGNDDYNPSNASAKIRIIRNQFIVTEDNFYTCFDKNGYLKSAYADYELIFKGNFNNKRIIINHPAILKSQGAKLSDSVIKIESDNVVVDGFTIVNSNPGNAKDNHRFAILLDNVKNVNVTNNNIKLSSFDNGYGIYVSESSNCNILNNKVKVKANTLTFGIMLYDSNKNTLKNNNVLVNGTSKPHLYDSTIKVDSSISVDDNEAEGMVIPEVYKTYGIILFYSSSNDIGYNNVNATSGVNKYYTAIKESTNSIVGIDLYYESNNNKVHNNNVNVTAKDPYLYGMGVLGAETGKRDQVSANNRFTDNVIFVSGTYYAAGIIAGYNSINTTMARNKINCKATNVTYGVILEGAENTIVSDNYVKSKSRIVYLLEGYDSDNGKISNNYLDYDKDSLLVRVVSFYNSKNNAVTNNSLPSIPKNRNIDLASLGLTDHADVIEPGNSLYTDIGGEGNTFDGNTVRSSNGASSGGTGTGSGGTNSGSGSTSNGSSSADSSSSNNGDNANANNSNANNENSANNSNANNENNANENVIRNNGSRQYSEVNGNSIYSNSTVLDGNTVGTTSSAPVSESATAYNLNVDEDPAAMARSLSLGGMNAPVLIIILLLIFACASELIKRSKRDIK